jgi:hypothetical protein
VTKLHHCTHQVITALTGKDGIDWWCSKQGQGHVAGKPVSITATKHRSIQAFAIDG